MEMSAQNLVGMVSDIEAAGMEQFQFSDPTGESEDQWREFTREARAAHVAEKDPDPWYRRWFMSEKARQTERHLGVD